jgi:hypothetical protein
MASVKGVRLWKKHLFCFRLNTQKVPCSLENCAQFCVGLCVTKQLRLLLTHISNHLGIFRLSKVYPWANTTQIANLARQLNVCHLSYISLRRLSRNRLTCSTCQCRRRSGTSSFQQKDSEKAKINCSILITHTGL